MWVYKPAAGHVVSSTATKYATNSTTRLVHVYGVLDRILLSHNLPALAFLVTGTRRYVLPSLTFQTGAHYDTHAGHELKILPPQPPE